MELAQKLKDLWLARAALRGPVGFVPTMGALHAGHEALIGRARDECRSVVVSIFVNPLQFGPDEDYAHYPRRLDADLALLSRYDVDLVVAPPVEQMYPGPLQCTVAVGSLGTFLEGERRPGHFNGVATVVLKLFHLVSPDRAYFGQKDAQQLAVVARLIKDFDLPIQLVACPTVRDADGLALSSRNDYLKADERREAPRLYRALRHAAERLEAGERDIAAVVRQAASMLAPLKLDYLAVVDPEVFEPLSAVPDAERLLVVGAARPGSTHLIDNVEVTLPARPAPEPVVATAARCRSHAERSSAN